MLLHNTVPEIKTNKQMFTALFLFSLSSYFYIVHTLRLRGGHQQDMKILKTRFSSLSRNQRGSTVLCQCWAGPPIPPRPHARSSISISTLRYSGVISCRLGHLPKSTPNVVLTTTGQWTLRHFICNLQNGVTSSTRKWGQTCQWPLLQKHHEGLLNVHYIGNIVATAELSNLSSPDSCMETKLRQHGTHRQRKAK